jgi:DNA (cytosine-5)-methyltransferase 1
MVTEKSISIGTMCSGIGAPEQALKKLGIPHKVKFACEIDKFARETYEMNYDPEFFYEDLTTLDYTTLPEVDLFVAGFPCQTFSTAGKRRGTKDPRGTIFFYIYEYLKEKQPDVFILENVKGLLTDDNGRTFQTILDLLAHSINGQQMFFPPEDNLGYHVHWKVLNSKDYGIPHNRDRVFIIGFKEHTDFKFPPKQHLTKWLKDFLDDNPDPESYLTEDHIASIIKQTNKHKARGNGFAFEFKHKDGLEIANCITTQKGMSIVTNNFILEKEVLPDHDQELAHLEDYLSQHHLLKSTVRVLTTAESTRLLGFPDDFKRHPNERQQYKQAGNSMVVDVLAALFKEIYLKGDKYAKI